MDKLRWSFMGEHPKYFKGGVYTLRQIKTHTDGRPGIVRTARKHGGSHTVVEHFGKKIAPYSYHFRYAKHAKQAYNWLINNYYKGV